MEIFNSRRRRMVGLIPAISTVLCFLLSACNSTDESIEDVQNDNKVLNNTNSEIIHLSNGDVIVLSDTTTYTVDEIEFNDADIIYEKASEDLFKPASRATNVLRAYGFDSQVPESDWRKYRLTEWEQYGVVPGTYVGRGVKVHKNLSIESGTYAVPADYSSDKAPKNVMGWDGATTTIGFTATNKNDYISDGVTTIFIINCDLSGRVYNKNIPADPSKFEWAYKLETKADIWD